jgi:hypothetical protein
MTAQSETAAGPEEAGEGARDRSYLLDVGIGAIALLAALVLNLLR